MNSSEIIKEWEKVAKSIGAKFEVPLKTMSLKLVMFNKSDLGNQTIQGFDLMGSSVTHDPSFILTRVKTNLKYKPKSGVISKATGFKRVLSLFFNYGVVIDSNYGKYWVKSDSGLLTNLDRGLKDELFKYPNIHLESNQKKSTMTSSTTKLIKNESELLSFVEVNNKLIKLLTN